MQKENKKIHKAKKSLELKPIHGFVRAKKALGQNFLKSEAAIQKIVEAGNITEHDIILEIGPGKGVLTKRLLQHSKKVIAVEKDEDLIQFLKEKFHEEIQNGKLLLIEGDILKFNPKAQSLMPSAYKIIANIPYNITGAILKKFLTEENQPELMVLMVQNEVAKRIVARDGKESILSISVKAYGEPKIIMKVPARYFSPAPKVDSAVIKIANISKSKFNNGGTAPTLDEEKFWQIIHAGFAHKRKILIGNLKNSVTQVPINGFEETFKKLGIPEKARAEDLTLSNWISLTKEL